VSSHPSPWPPELPVWITAAELLPLVGITGTPTAAQSERAQLAADSVNTGMARVLDRVPGDPVLEVGRPELEHAAAQAATYAYRRFDTAFDSVNYADLTVPVKVARDALAYVAPLLERWRRIGVG
jgi:hypothetical protein